MEKKSSNIRIFLQQRGISPKNLALWLIAAAVVISAAFLFGGLSAGKNQVFPVRISEIMADNSLYPNSDGLCCDYIEVYNSADYPVDLSGFQLGDVAGKSRYVFPSGTLLQPGEYLTVYCNKTANSPEYAPFEINRAGGESFYLIARNGAVVDRVTTVAMKADQVMLPQADGSWQVSANASPGGNEDTQDIYNEELSQVRFSEFSAADAGYLVEHRIFCDWVELHNNSSQPVDLSGYILSDNPGNDKYVFPENTVIAAGGYLTVYCTDQVSDPKVAPFGLSRLREETLVLKNRQGQIVELLRTYPNENMAMAITAEGQWEATDLVTPGFENTPQGRSLFLLNSGTDVGGIRISEVMAADQLLLKDSFDRFPDWVELYNTLNYPVNLSGWCLSDDPAQPRKWIIPDMILEPGQRKIVFCSGRDVNADGEIHTGFALSSGGETLVLSAWTGETVDCVTFPKSEAHTAFVFDEQGQCINTACPTPGYPNDEESYLALCDANVPVGPLAIWELMSSNDKYLPQKLGACYDWLELRNISSQPLDLTGYTISDDLDAPAMHSLAGVTLQPGQSVVIILSEEPNVANEGVDQALFQLDAREDQLFLFDPQGKLLDYVHVKDVPLGYSYGRSGTSGGFFYMEPSPQNPNFAGYRLISGEIDASCDSGVYSLEESIVLTLNAQGAIYYTTDGSVPDVNSNPYTSPLQINQTTVIRAVSIEEGKLPGKVYTVTFIIGDQHQLPVVSLVTDPDNLWGPDGIYKNDLSVKEIQVPAHVSYSGADGSFSINCALNLHGATTVKVFPKKTFAVRFQDRYDGPLHYDVFEDGVVTDYSSLLIRTAYESTYSSQMHDAFICHVAACNSDKLISQKYKYVALYLNGEYFGLYAIRERHSEELFASYMHVPADGVQIVRYMTTENNDLKDLYQLLKRDNLRSDENYAYAKSILNMESYADWIIYEAYMANIDIHANVRFYRNPVDGIWYMGLADLDLGMMENHESFSMLADCFHHGLMIDALMRNEEFQHLLATRLAQLLEGPLSDENAIAMINQMADTIRDETVWEEERWGTPVHSWEVAVQYMIDFCDGRTKELIDNFCMQMAFTEEEREAYFGHLE